MEKEMATHSIIVARKIPWTEETCGSQRVGHDSLCPWGHKELDMAEHTCVHAHTHTHTHTHTRAFPAGSVVKNLPAMQETWVQSLGKEDTQEKGMVTHSSILACRFPWTEGPRDLKELDMTEQLSLWGHGRRSLKKSKG